MSRLDGLSSRSFGHGPVDGCNPAPVDRLYIPLFTLFL